MLALARALSPTAVRAACRFYRLSHTYAPMCVPAVVVGAGPTGLVLSCLLSQYGIRHLVLEKSHQLTQHPQAHYINNRTMEVFRGLPGLAAAVQADSPPLDEWRRFIYCESMAAGQLLGEVDHFPGQSAPHDPAVSPEPVTHLSQHRLLPLLLQQAQQLSAANGNCADIQFSRAVTAISNVEFPHHQHQHQHMHMHMHLQAHVAGRHGDQQVAAVVQDAAAQHPQQQQQGLQEDLSAQEYPVCVAVEQQPGGGAAGAGGGRQLVRCSYLVAADGAHSTIRTLLGIPLLGEAALQHLISIHFSWRQLGQALLSSGRSAMLYFVFNRELVAVVVAHDLQRGEFVAQVPYYPPLQSPTDFTPDVCKQLITAAAGWSQQQPADSSSSSSSGLQLHSVKNWVMGAQVAQDYTAWDGRVLLAGDAAHSFPPAGGFGMNTGIQDAHNLAWKLAAVISGTAEPELLSTYTTERRPVATANSQLSINNWHEAIKVPQALGLDPQAAELVNKVAAAAPLPGPASKWLLDFTLAAGRGLAAAVTPLRRGALEEILRTGQSLRLQFPKEDLGFVYRQGAVVVTQGGENMVQGDSSSSSSSDVGRGATYVPSTVVGGRLPHCWLALPGQQGGEQQVSTLDLVTADSAGLNMLLICSSSSSSGGGGVAQPAAAAAAAASGDIDWLAAGLQLQQQGWPLRVMRILPQGTLLPHDKVTINSSNSNTTTSCNSSSRTNWSNGSSCTAGLVASLCDQLDAVDVNGTWARLHPGCSSVAMLVRPDGHVAWRKVHAGSLERHVVGQASSRPSNSGSFSQGVDELLLVLKDHLHLRSPSDDSD